MSNCIRCGATMGEFDAGGNMTCQNCEATSSGHGSGTDVPCQRCGMYLPPHELRMWNSRLYCAYCIMDVQDEENRAKVKHHEHVEGAGEYGRPDLPQDYSKTSGTCERCGKSTDTLYTVSGRRLCAECASEHGGISPAGSSALGILASFVKGALGMDEKPKLVEKKGQPQVFDIRNRKMMDKADEKSEGGAGKRADSFGNPLRKTGTGSSGDSSEKFGSSPQAPSAAPSEVFDIRDRKLVEKKEGMEAQTPISEGAEEEKKPPKKFKKLFFKMHPASGAAKKKS